MHVLICNLHLQYAFFFNMRHNNVACQHVEFVSRHDLFYYYLIRRERNSQQGETLHYTFILYIEI